jgi:hypothetical protein
LVKKNNEVLKKNNEVLKKKVVRERILNKNDSFAKMENGERERKRERERERKSLIIKRDDLNFIFNFNEV